MLSCFMLLSCLGLPAEAYPGGAQGVRAPPLISIMVLFQPIILYTINPPVIDDSCIIRPYIIAYSSFHKQGCIIIITMRVTQRLINVIVAPPSATLAKH